MVIHYTDAKGVGQGVTLEAHMARLFTRPAIKDDPELQKLMIAAGHAYLEMMREHTGAMQAVLELGRQRIPIYDALENVRSDTEKQALEDQLAANENANKLKIEHRTRCEFHMVEYSDTLVNQFMARDGMIDEYREFLLTQPPSGRDVFNDELLKTANTEGRTEAARRLVGSVIHKALDIVVHEKGDHGVPFSFDVKGAYLSLVNSQLRRLGLPEREAPSQQCRDR